ncbi:hypothetical protein GQX73_g6780 [Xylaria multiplex]|uniref:LysM domain-containing protein n=1 Tax=Xylaria multiplex TaxID=323545 RepID=A0A7C8MMR5_9PEZI|nr:hypothetical protein GQX73_g6780 [Xylaria multiplex]
MNLCILWLLFSTIWYCTLAADPSFFFLTNQSESLFDGVSSSCNLALSAPVGACPRELLNYLGKGEFYTLVNETVMDVLCRDECPAALTNYRSEVITACATDPQPEPGYPAAHWVDAVSSVQVQLYFIQRTLGDALDPNELLGGYAPADLYSECVVNLFRHQQSTPYSNYDPGMAEAWAAIQANCNLSFPTATQTLKTNVTSLGNYAPPGYPTASCVGGRNYTVVSGDNCNDIAKKTNVSTGFLITLNSLRMDCSNLLIGQNLCIPPACDAYEVQPENTCVGIATQFSTSFQQIIAWNPTINPYCTNLIAGQNICVGPPGGFQNFSTIPGASVTKTAIYATTTADRPSSVASGTTTKCGKYYTVQLGDYCELVALNQTISLDLLLALNPQIDAGCTNLQANVAYCVLPTQDWNTTTTSTIAPAPTSTPPGTTEECYEWYIIQGGDYCAKVQDKFGITFEQFQGWNPSINEDCSNLELGVAYCVNGATAIAARATSEAHDGRQRQKLAIRGAGPTQTLAPDVAYGGVAIGWPGVDSPRRRKQMGLQD